jgi:magnesium-transporting ATPase (P-type)
MAMAVNMALMSLMKTGIFCTEPYKVPISGKVSHCLFDKTGTITTDTLLPIGVINSHNPVFEREDKETALLAKSSLPLLGEDMYIYT